MLTLSSLYVVHPLFGQRVTFFRNMRLLHESMTPS